VEAKDVATTPQSQMGLVTGIEPATGMAVQSNIAKPQLYR
jgi:hypothetical protein